MTGAHRVLAADIGGTKIRMAIISPEAGRLRIHWESMMPSTPEFSLEEIVIKALPARLRRGLPAVFAVAGPVRRGQAKLTNLPWEISADHLERTLELEKLELINDVEAMACSLPEKPDLPELKSGKALSCGHRAVLSLGTGLGEGGAVYAEGRHHPWAGEGGHCDWAPNGELEWELHRFLSAESSLEHLSRERILSGAGLVGIARFFARKEGREDVFPPGGPPEDPAATVHRAARDKTDPACEKALDLFVRLLGAEAGNLALATGATGGLFIGGGMAVKLHHALRKDTFREAFLAKGRMRDFLKDIPVMLLPDEKAPLLGAARHALSFSTSPT